MKRPRVDDRGYFSVILSAQRPEGHDGDWWELGPSTRRLLMRKCACDWNHEIDARVKILTSLRLEALDHLALKDEIRRLGTISSPTAPAAR